jgi:hypothetical protein
VRQAEQQGGRAARRSGTAGDNRPQRRRRRPGRSASGGGGLGLAIVAEVIRAHGGEAAARSNPRGGLPVWFRLPGTSSTVSGQWGIRCPVVVLRARQQVIHAQRYLPN